jgi:hypothetical protein
MAGSDDFDMTQLLAAPVQLIGLMMGGMEATKQTLTAAVETVASLQRSAAGLEELIERLNGIVNVVEVPARALAPEMERFAQRLHDIGDALDGPLETILPGVQRVATMFERAPLEQLPETLTQFNDQLQKIVGGMGDLPRRLGPLSDLLGGAASMFGIGRPSAPEPPATPPVTIDAATRTPSTTQGKKASAKTPVRKAPAKQAAPGKAPAKRAKPTKG